MNQFNTAYVLKRRSQVAPGRLLGGIQVHVGQKTAAEKKAHEFMFDKMMLLEDFYREYRDFFKYG